MLIPYLSNTAVALRPIEEHDTAHAQAWFPGIFPVSAAQASDWLKKYRTPWAPPDLLPLIIEDATDRSILGSALVARPVGTSVEVQFHPNPALLRHEGDRVLSNVLPVLHRWLLDDQEALVLDFWLPADFQQSLIVAEELGLRTGVRLREHLARPGGRVDLLILQALGEAYRLESDDA